MQRRVAWMAAFVHQRLGRLLGPANLNDLLGRRVRLAEVRAESALPVVNVLHARAPMNGESLDPPCARGARGMPNSTRIHCRHVPFGSGFGLSTTGRWFRSAIARVRSATYVAMRVMRG